MRKNKHFTTFVSLTLGVVLLITAAFANYGNALGYSAYKQGLLNMLGQDNYSVELEATITVDGVEFVGGSFVEKFDRYGDVVSYSANSSYEAAYPNGGGGSEEWSVRDVSPTGDGDFITYNRNGYSDQWNIRRDWSAGGQLSELNGLDTSDEYNQRMVRLVELAADMLVGDLKNNFVYTGRTDAGKEYQISINKAQLPEIVQVFMDLIASETFGYSYDFEISNSVDEQPVAVPTAMPSSYADDIIEPDVIEPDVTEPDVTEPENTEPDVTEPENTEPDVTEPENTEPDVTEPEDIEPATNDNPVPDDYVAIDGAMFEEIAAHVLSGMELEDIAAAFPELSQDVLDAYISMANNAMNEALKSAMESSTDEATDNLFDNPDPFMLESEWPQSDISITEAQLMRDALSNTVGFDFVTASCNVTIDDDGYIAHNTLSATILLIDGEGVEREVVITVTFRVFDVGTTVIDMPIIPDDATIYDYSIGNATNGWAYNVTRNGITVQNSQQSDNYHFERQWFNSITPHERVTHVSNYVGNPEQMLVLIDMFGNATEAPNAQFTADGEMLTYDEVLEYDGMVTYVYGLAISSRVPLTLEFNPSDPQSVFDAFYAHVDGIYSYGDLVDLQNNMDVSREWIINRIAADCVSTVFPEYMFMSGLAIEDYPTINLNNNSSVTTKNWGFAIVDRDLDDDGTTFRLELVDPNAREISVDISSDGTNSADLLIDVNP